MTDNECLRAIFAPRAVQNVITIEMRAVCVFQNQHYMIVLIYAQSRLFIYVCVMDDGVLCVAFGRYQLKMKNEMMHGRWTYIVFLIALS